MAALTTALPRAREVDREVGRLPLGHVEEGAGARVGREHEIGREQRGVGATTPAMRRIAGAASGPREGQLVAEARAESGESRRPRSRVRRRQAALDQVGVDRGAVDRPTTMFASIGAR